MRYRKISADKIFDGFRFLEKDIVVIVNEDGRIENTVDKTVAGEGIEHYKGILSPGFINSHCHLELSHMKAVIPPGTGLVDFLINVVTKRSQKEESFILQRIEEAENEMYQNGISGVADISNTLHTLATKKTSLLAWHNLVEIINFFDKTLPDRLAHNKAILEQFQNLPFATAFTPHAPYTVNAATFEAINKATRNKVISIHNQETAAENELFKSGTGDFLRLYTAVGLKGFPLDISSKSSLQTYLPHFTNGQTIVLVHNTFTSEEDIVFASYHAQRHGLKIVYCLCPNANLYIEKALPPIDLFLKHNCNIVLGTDSYSSNWQLSIARELEVIQKNFPSISTEQILQWATSNGASTFNWPQLGTLARGTTPGIALLETHSLEGEHLTGSSRRIL